MVLLLLIVLLVVFGGVGYNTWGPNGLGGALGLFILIVLLLMVFDRLPLHNFC